MLHHSEPSQIDSGERNACWLPEGLRLLQSSSVKRAWFRFTASWTHSIKAASPANPARSASSKLVFTHTFPTSAPSRCQVCSVFPVSAARNLGWGPSWLSTTHCQSRGRKKATYPVHLHSSPLHSPHPVFTHSFHFNARAPCFVSIFPHFPPVLKPHRLCERLLSGFLFFFWTGGDVVVSLWRRCGAFY